MRGTEDLESRRSFTDGSLRVAVYCFTVSLRLSPTSWALFIRLISFDSSRHITQPIHNRQRNKLQNSNILSLYSFPGLYIFSRPLSLLSKTSDSTIVTTSHLPSVSSHSRVSPLHFIFASKITGSSVNFTTVPLPIILTPSPVFLFVSIQSTPQALTIFRIVRIPDISRRYCRKS